MRSCPNWLLLSLAISFASPLVLCAQSTDSERHQSHVRIETSGNGSDAARLFSQRLQALQGRALDWTKAEQEKIARFLEGQNLHDREEVLKKLAEDDEIRKLAMKYARQPGTADQLNKQLRPEKLERFKSVIEEFKKKQGDPLSVPKRTDPAGRSGTEPERPSNPSSNNHEGEERSNPAAGPSHSEPAIRDPDHVRAEADARQQLHRFGDLLDDAADRFRDSPAV